MPITVNELIPWDLGWFYTVTVLNSSCYNLTNYQSDNYRSGNYTITGEMSI